jgi:hypothetical protein
VPGWKVENLVGSDDYLLALVGPDAHSCNRASRCLVQTVVEIEQDGRVRGKEEPPTLVCRRDVSDERVVAKARVRSLEVVDALQNQLPQLGVQGLASRDLPLRPERAEPETGVHGLAAVDPGIRWHSLSEAPARRA